MYISTLPNLPLEHATVFLRVDLNVPMRNKKILDDYKLIKSLETIDYILQKKANIVLATHIGRPTGFDEELSTKNLLAWFKERHYDIAFEADIYSKDLQTFNYPTQIVLVENLRFFKEEQMHALQFAQMLKGMGSFYINDAFGTLHRDDVSVALLATLYSPEKKTFGFLVEKELNMLSTLKNNPPRPFSILIGGAKVKEKTEIMQSLIAQTDQIFIAPAISFAFMQQKNLEIGTSFIEENSVIVVDEFLETLKNYPTILYEPIDYLVEENNTYSNKKRTEFTKKSKGISIGEQTIELYCNALQKSKTILINGAFGFQDKPETLEPFFKILTSISQQNVVSVVCGGDSSGIARQLGFENKLSYLSTGGGSALAYLSNKKMPGLEALL